jgi:hypothetical protein
MKEIYWLTSSDGTPVKVTEQVWFKKIKRVRLEREYDTRRFWLRASYIDRMAIERQAPSAAEFVLFMLPRERREDVMVDLGDWYPTWCEEFGTRQAKFLCWWRVTCCVGGAVLEVLGRVGEIIGKMAPK